ncbi:hypothetical protein SAMN05216421_3237 [Halopseudomonas xinjiangensis]|uniref:Protein FliT n=1 Tax=Halopseudomonas xinjiangensis TaxID=487184 RepID=A0A1H1YQN2_9GAMM|nr:hypothetical protein [Halopseudomonas xinjiangensis]SDT23723.1 hypothetical protein SAMN05216421_3237 [Halopseudomonas xinjiangensis]
MQHAKPHSARLAGVLQQLRAALDASDWDAIGSSNLMIRELLAWLPADSALDEQARQLKQDLQALHAEALTRCRAECDRLRDVLHSHTEHAEGRSAYMQIDSLGDGR